MNNIPHLLLAAGTSKRMGEPKQLLRWGNKSLIQFQMDTIAPTSDQFYVTLGAYADLIEPLLKSSNAEVIRYEYWENGMGNSLAFSIQQILQSNRITDGVLISLIDQPLVKASHYLKMRAVFEKGKKQIIVSESDLGWLGVPVLFDAHYFEELQSLSGEEGAKKMIKKYSKNTTLVKAGKTLVDMDTPEMYRKLHDEFSPQW